MSDPAANPQSLVGTSLGAYRIEAELGPSRWGTVYRAIQTTVHRPVVLKILAPAMAEMPGKVDHFLAESRSGAQIIHHHIVSVYEAGCVDNTFYCAMEHMDGPPLAEFLRNGAEVDEHHLLLAVIGIGRALEFLWLREIPHQPPLALHILINSLDEVKLTNITPAEVATSVSQSEDIAALGYAIAGITNEIGAVRDSIRELVERMVAMEGRPPLKTVDALIAAATKLDQQLFPPQRPAAVVERSQPKKAEPAILIAGIVIALALAAGGGYWFMRQRNGGAADMPRPADIGTMVQIPAGSFKPATGTATNLPAFWIDKYEVTIGEYHQFLEARKAGEDIEEHLWAPKNKTHIPPEWDTLMKRIAAGQLDWDSPIVGVDWFDAYACAKWRKKRLPTELEWEKAARGPEGFTYAWGNTLAPGKCNYAVSDKAPALAKVYSHPSDSSSHGVIGLTGNASEWTATGPSRDKAVIRGASWQDTDPQLTTRRTESRPYWSTQVGFRCAADTEVKPKTAAPAR